MRDLLSKSLPFAILSVALAFWACDDVHDPTGPGSQQTLSIDPTTATVEVDATQQFTAVGRDAEGVEVEISPTWSIVNGGGTIDSDGLFTAGGTTGTFANTVQVTSGGNSATATVTVVEGPAESMTVSPDPAVLPINGTRQFTAEARDAGGNVVEITPIWSIVNGGGTITSGGLFTAGGTSGTFENTVQATSGDLSATATVEVTNGLLTDITVTPDPSELAPGDTEQFTAVGTDSEGNTVVITPTWSVVAGGGTIDSVGFFTAGNTSGTFGNTVEATSDGITGNATVIVSEAPSEPIVDLGPNGILAGTEVTCISGGTIFADVSIHPGGALTGFPPCQLTGDTHLADAVAEQAQIDLTTAFNTLVGLDCDTDIVADLGGTTLTPAVYCTGSGIGVTGTLTLDGQGDSGATFVFQAGTSLTTAGDVELINGAQAKNVFWVIGSSATLGTASQWQGNILVQTSVTLNDNAILTGRALARDGAVTLGNNNVITLP